MDYESEIIALKNTVERHSDRLAAIEKSAAEDHSTLKSVKKDVESMKTDMAKIKDDIGTIKLQNVSASQQIGKLIKWLKIIGAVTFVVFVFMIIRNEQQASAIVSIGTTIAKLFV